MNVVYQKDQFKLTSDSEVLSVDEVFVALSENKSFDQDTLEFHVAQFLIKMKYVPVFVYNKGTYRMIAALAITNQNAAQFVPPDIFHTALVSYVSGAGYNVTTV